MLVTESVMMSDEKRLIKHLLDNYERVGIVGRPVFNTSETVRVTYGLALIQILDLDEKNQVLTTNVWSRYVSTSSPSLSLSHKVAVMVISQKPKEVLQSAKTVKYYPVCWYKAMSEPYLTCKQ